MARAITWAIRVTLPEGRRVFLRAGGELGRGPILTFYSKAEADKRAADFRRSTDLDDRFVTVIERSHGRSAR